MPPVSAPFNPPVAKWPALVFDAVAGRSTALADSGASTALGMAAIVARVPTPTCAVVELGVNDAAILAPLGALTLPVFSAQINTIVDAINAAWGIPYSRMLWIGPWAHDSGDIDTQITQARVQLETNAAAKGFGLVRWQGIPNTIPTFSPTDGTHPTPAGCALLAAPIMAQLTFS